MEHDHAAHDGVPSDPYDEFLMATMAWEGGLPQPVADGPDPDAPEHDPDSG